MVCPVTAEECEGEECEEEIAQSFTAQAHKEGGEEPLLESSKTGAVRREAYTLCIQYIVQVRFFLLNFFLRVTVQSSCSLKRET